MALQFLLSQGSWVRVNVRFLRSRGNIESSTSGLSKVTFLMREIILINQDLN